MRYSVFFYDDGHDEPFDKMEYSDPVMIPRRGDQVVLEDRVRGETPYRVTDVTVWYSRREVSIGLFLRLDVEEAAMTPPEEEPDPAIKESIVSNLLRAGGKQDEDEDATALGETGGSAEGEGAPGIEGA